jgi:hypothetical protein
MVLLLLLLVLLLLLLLLRWRAAGGDAWPRPPGATMIGTPSTTMVLHLSGPLLESLPGKR